MKVVKRYKGLTDRIENIENIDTLVAIQIDCFHIVSALESTNIAIYVSSRDSLLVSICVELHISKYVHFPTYTQNICLLLSPWVYVCPFLSIVFLSI